MMHRAAAFVAAAALLWMGAAVAEEEPYPVRFNPWLGLASVDDAIADVRRGRPSWGNWGVRKSLEVVKASDDFLAGRAPLETSIVDRAVATTCAEFRTLTEAGYFATGWPEAKLPPILKVECRIMAILADGRPARESHVRDFVMSAEAVHVLPVMLDTSSLEDRRCEEYIANRQGVPWSRFDKIVEVDVDDEYVMHVSTEHRDGRIDVDDDYYLIGGSWVRVNILAWGDFNGDGYDDVLVRSSAHPVTWSPTTGTSSTAKALFGDAFILTRYAPDAVLRVVDAERYLTPAAEPCVYP